MVGGQAIDLESVGRELDQQALETMHRHKTGALIEASVQLGALASGKADVASLRSLQQYARAVGLAFQVQDDILDVESDTATLGKTQGKDEANHKPTYPALLGLEQAKAYASVLLHGDPDQAGIIKQTAKQVLGAILPGHRKDKR